MAFVEIQRGKDKKNVSYSSFKNFFQSAGWEVAGEIPATSAIPVKEEKKKQHKKEKVEDPVVDEWDAILKEEADEEGIEKPISEMNKKELIKYAEDHNISLAGLTTVNQFRNAIQEKMKEV